MAMDRPACDSGAQGGVVHRGIRGHDVFLVEAAVGQAHLGVEWGGAGSGQGGHGRAFSQK